MRRITLVGIMVAVAAGSMTLATPAQADAAACRNYLSNLGYPIGTVEAKACAKADNGHYNYCVTDLIARRIPAIHAEGACEQGRRE